MNRYGLRPRWSLYLWDGAASASYREVFTFGISWKVIAVVLLLDVVFLFPVFNVLQDTVELWQRSDELFHLTAALFTTFWLLGWSMAPLLITLVLLLLLFGREEVRAQAGELDVIIGLPIIGVRTTYRVDGIRNLRIELPQKGSGKYWRGGFVTFDYGANSGEFGSNVTEIDLPYIRDLIESASGATFRTGDALPAELTGEWREKPQPAVETFAAHEETVSLSSPSSLLLIAANIVPLLGAVFWGWDLGAVMLLYWAESAVIGFFNLCKIIVVSQWGALFYAPFFLAHFGAFMSVHFLFMYTFFLSGDGDGPNMEGSMDEVALLFLSVWPGLLALVLSHGYSFFHNFIGRKEYLGRSGREQMAEPYRRILFMHMVIIFGGGLAMILGDPTPVLMGVIVLKAVFDLRGHLKQRESGTVLT